MQKLLTSEAMRQIESRAISRGETTGAAMMEMAGEGVVAAIAARWPDLAPGRVVVLSGPGNNGGDGFVIARLLKAQGWDVRICFVGDESALAPDARAARDAWVGPVETPDTRSLGTIKAPPVLVIDALFGTGLTRDIEGDAEFLLTNLATLRELADVRVVAVDIPSGICADTGRVLGTAPRADLTVTFHSEKRGHRLEDGPEHCGDVVVAGIGLAGEEPEEEPDPDDLVLVTQPPADVLNKSTSDHKYSHGHAVVICMRAAMTGAPRLAARAALRVGAGLVSLAVTPKAETVVAAHVTAVMTKVAKGPMDLGELLWDTRLNALCIGPGLGKGQTARDWVETVLNVQRPTVLDADGLTAFEDMPSDLWLLTHERTVLTPHWGEFARIFPDLASRTQEGELTRLDAVKAAAKRAGAVVLLKGADTLIAAPDGRAAIHSARYGRAAPWLATAGTGDVLAGLITGLMARRQEAFDAAGMAAWLHCEAALEFGPGLIAEDLSETLPKVLARVCSQR